MNRSIKAICRQDGKAKNRLHLQEVKASVIFWLLNLKILKPQFCIKFYLLLKNILRWRNIDRTWDMRPLFRDFLFFLISAGYWWKEKKYILRIMSLRRCFFLLGIRNRYLPKDRFMRQSGMTSLWVWMPRSSVWFTASGRSFGHIPTENTSGLSGE